ncbi:MAG: hypothetical protein ABIY70_11305 [Capsulimonas sp.]|uniref:hypothetical protein n=1 Tax=Capsulimonas sp. TaxID=2494211 RepID=UPI003263FBB3
MMTKKWLLLPVSLAFAAAIYGYVRHRQSYTGAQLAVELQRSGDMNKTDAEHFGRIQDQTSDRTPLSDGDVDWLMDIARRPGTTEQMETRRQWAGIIFMVAPLAKVSPTRKDAIFTFAAELTAYRNPVDPKTDDSGGRYMACKIFRNLRDDRALPYLTVLTHDPDVVVRVTAQHDIRLLTHKLRPGEAP